MELVVKRSGFTTTRSEEERFGPRRMTAFRKCAVCRWKKIARQNSTIDCRGRGSKLVSDSSIAIESSARWWAVAKRWEWRLSSEACCAKSGSEMELVQPGRSKSKPLASSASFRRGRAWRDGEISRRRRCGSDYGLGLEILGRPFGGALASLVLAGLIVS